LIDFTGNAKLADFNVMKNVEATLARTQKGTPLFMAPEVAYGERYSEKVDIWSLCASFYYIFKSHGPFYTHNVKSSVELMIRKKNIDHYEKLNERYCPNELFRKIINFNLCSPDAKRMSAEDILKMMDKELSILSEAPTEEDKMTVFGATQGTNFMDETLVSQEISLSKLKNNAHHLDPGVPVEESQVLRTQTEYRTNAESVFETTGNLQDRNLSLTDQIDKKYDALEAEAEVRRNDSYYDKLNFIKPTKVNDTLNDSELVVLETPNKKAEGVDPSIYRRDASNLVNRKLSDSPQIGVLVISDDSHNQPEEFEDGNYSLEEEFEDCLVSDDDEIELKINYDEETKQKNEQKKSDEMMFDSMMAPRPTTLLPTKQNLIAESKATRKTNPQRQKNQAKEPLMASFLSKTGENETRVDFEYTRSMATPSQINKAMREYNTRNNKVNRQPQPQKEMRNNLISTGDNVQIRAEDIKKYKQKPQKKEPEFEENFDDFGDFEQYDDDFQVYDDFDDLNDDYDNGLDKTKKTTFQGENPSDSFYETQFGKTEIQKTQNYVDAHTPKVVQRKVHKEFDFTN
jgi:hypothetical protein